MTTEEIFKWQRFAFLAMFDSVSDYFQTTFRQLSENFPTTFQLLFWQLFNNFLTMLLINRSDLWLHCPIQANGLGKTSLLAKVILAQNVKMLQIRSKLRNSGANWGRCKRILIYHDRLKSDSSLAWLDIFRLEVNIHCTIGMFPL